VNKPVAQETILIVDDEKTIRTVLSCFLNDIANVHTASDGKMAVAAAVELMPNLILLDISMPDMDGYEVCRRLKEIPQTSQIPIIFITGNDSSDDEERGLAMGAVDFIKKPCSPSVVRFRVTNVLRLHQIQRELEHLAATDPLTGTNNRRQFMMVGQTEFLRSRRYKNPLSILMMDIDDFKSINDNYGHGTGDEALKMAVNTFTSALRAEDTLGRLGGEEFAALLPESGIESACVLAERLRAAIGAAVLDTSEGSVSFTVSIGVSELKDDDDDILSVLGRADKLLYAAKENGRDRVEYTGR